MTKMPPSMPKSDPVSFSSLFEAHGETDRQLVISTSRFERRRCTLSAGEEALLDHFPDCAGVACAFLRLPAGSAPLAQFSMDGLYGLERSASGGWLLCPAEAHRPTFWMPQLPIGRRYDAQGRILAEVPATLQAFRPTSTASWLILNRPCEGKLELVVWRFSAEAPDIVDGLERLSAVETQPVFMWSSHTTFRSTADVYTYLLHGKVYENRFDFRRKRKVCSELEAYSLYVTLGGLEAATGKTFYRLLRRQILHSVIARQAAQGGWEHGEWTDMMESHYRFHDAAMLLLATAQEEQPDATVAAALERAAGVLAASPDRTDVGAWFLHDSLESSVELMKRSGMRWFSSGILGKSPSNKLILNTHLDAIVTLDRYREVSGDARHAETVSSAVAATRAILALRPAEWLYRPLYRAIGLTLLPSARVRQLSLPARMVRRLTEDHLTRRVYRLKRRYPRLVMPGGLIERHLSRLHFGVNYHTVNVSDLARVWRRFPSDDLDSVIEGGVRAVTETGLLELWVESKQRQGLGYWVEALYHLCTLKPELAYRSHLAQAMVAALDAGLGLSPSLLGANPEAVPVAERVACPSPVHAVLRVANLSRGGQREFLVVNPTAQPVDLRWEAGREPGALVGWTSSDGDKPPGGESIPTVPARGWVLGRA
jgi:hypothetical protein